MKYIKVEIPITDYYFLIAFIWRRKKDFLKANIVRSSSDACYQDVHMPGDYPQVGELHFVKGLIGAGMVAHEVTHAARAFQRKQGKKKNEEYLAETAQIMTIGFWDAVIKNKKLNKWIKK